MKQLMLPVCVLPGCDTPVGDTGDVCTGCQQAFGSMLQPGGERLTQDQITARDEGVTVMYAAMFRRT